eukprot:symbB.v1.2.024437.t1/scaffold2308.1/size82747/5
MDSVGAICCKILVGLTWTLTTSLPETGTGTKRWSLPVHSAVSASAMRTRTPQPVEWDQDAFSRMDLSDAWAEVQQARRNLEQRERHLEQREAALRRSEARHRVSLRKVSDMRRRLEDYGEELEDAMAQVLAQQDELREERRRSSELHARARQMLDATRQNGGASKWREWEKTLT